MKLWRKLAKKEPVTGKRNGREICYQLRMSEQMSKLSAKTTPLLESLFKRAGVTYTLTKKQQEQVKKMAEEAASQQAEKEVTDETK